MPLSGAVARQPSLPSNWERLLTLAQAEVKATVDSLPLDLRDQAAQLPVTYEPEPNRDLRKDGIEPDTLGLFVGEPFSAGDTMRGPIPAQIILFLKNIWEMAEEDEDFYREEIRTTLLHELGHFLGLDEDDLEERGLD